MATKSYTPISGFWFALVPAVLVGLGYYLWHSHGYLALRLQEVIRPVTDLVTNLYSSLF